MKTKIFVITVDEAYDMDNTVTVEETGYPTMRAAKKRLRELKENAHFDFKREIEEEEWVFEEYDTSFQIYEGGRYVENHYCANITEISVDIPEQKKK